MLIQHYSHNAYIYMFKQTMVSMIVIMNSYGYLIDIMAINNLRLIDVVHVALLYVFCVSFGKMYAG